MGLAPIIRHFGKPGRRPRRRI